LEFVFYPPATGGTCGSSKKRLAAKLALRNET
jgi:hypothetical protein